MMIPNTITIQTFFIFYVHDNQHITNLSTISRKATFDGDIFGKSAMNDWMSTKLKNVCEENLISTELSVCKRCSGI